MTALLIAVLTLTGCCSRMNIESYSNLSPKVDVKEYFSGPIKAWGIVQDRKGRVTTRFDVLMVGSWDGDRGVLEEDFTYYDGRQQRRVWTITKTGENTYEGTADDIIGKATGQQNGSAVRWAYDMNLEVGDKTYKIRFDDWMWLMNDGVLVNRSYLKKFGLTVAELTLFMQKVES